MVRSLLPRRFAPSTPRHDSLLQDMALGAVAGLLGTLAMTPVTSKLSSLLSRKFSPSPVVTSPAET